MLIRIGKWVVGVVLAGLVVVPIAGWLYQTTSAASALRATPAPGQLVVVDGKRMHIHCLGTGSPTIVLERGLTASAATNGPLHRELAETTRTCAYDRSGLGYSELRDAHSSVEGVATQLRGLLDGAGIAEPVVLVGSSIGGVFVRSFYDQYPTRVAGMVLLDSTYEYEEVGDGAVEPVYPPGILVFASWVQPFGLVRLLGLVEAKVDRRSGNLLESDRAQLVATYGQSDAPLGMLHEWRTANDMVMANRKPSSLGDLPLIVLTQDTPPREEMTDEEWAEELADAQERNSLHQSLAGLSTEGVWRIAEGSGHGIEADAPEVAAAAVLEIVERARTR